MIDWKGIYIGFLFFLMLPNIQHPPFLLGAGRVAAWVLAFWDVHSQMSKKLCQSLPGKSSIMSLLGGGITLEHFIFLIHPNWHIHCFCLQFT